MLNSRCHNPHSRKSATRLNPFILRFEEMILYSPMAPNISKIKAGTRTVTEVSKEESDADRASHRYFIFNRKG
ncbi:hypothetical protein Pla110_22330 [Polystyrenella longa]|uniref:Uncharacterized protein n=1 Tax=Polystyrenella longa TaxID=2528007 RepID=A0A518CMR7_9PLAN|nr:hypothetical protein Pla110_22330 [Polystyrenella longa]